MDKLYLRRNFNIVMNNVIRWRAVNVLLLLLGTASICNAEFFDTCNNAEREKPSEAYLRNPKCWTEWDYGVPWQCDCGRGFEKTVTGSCKRGHCSPGYSPNSHGDCLHCPDENERLCLPLHKCVCLNNHQRDENNRCVPCPRDKISDGYADCKCKPDYSQNIYGICEKCGENERRNDETKKCECYSNYARDESGKCIFCLLENHEIHYTSHNDTRCTCLRGFQLNKDGNCKRNPRRYGILFCSIGFAIFCILGLVCGYAVRQYRGSPSDPIPVDV